MVQNEISNSDKDSANRAKAKESTSVVKWINLGTTPEALEFR